MIVVDFAVDVDQQADFNRFLNFTNFYGVRIVLQLDNAFP